MLRIRTGDRPWFDQSCRLLTKKIKLVTRDGQEIGRNSLMMNN